MGLSERVNQISVVSECLLPFSIFNLTADDEVVKASIDERMMSLESSHDILSSCFSSSSHLTPVAHLV